MGLIVLLLVLFLIIGGIGLAVKGLIWLAIVGAVLFVGTAVLGFVRRKSLHR